MQQNYNPGDWYWRAADERVFSSKRMLVVNTSDQGYINFVAQYGGCPPWPRDAQGEQSIAAIQDVLTPHNLYASAPAYAGGVRWVKINGGVVYQGHPISTDDASRSNIMAETVAAQVMGSGFTTAWKCSDGSWMPIADAAAMIAFGTAVRNYVAGCFAIEESLAAATSKEQVDEAAWPSNVLT